ncbi:MAG: AAA family ATPase, partial [Planctomycetes bacterium RBG_16_64_12]
MTFYADLHVHSKHSRATSRDGDLEHMAFWARKKGVSVLGTGDFTHPEWFGELQEKLVPAEPGLYRLRADLEKQVDQWLDGPGHQPKVGPGPVRFVLQVEISTIYKRDDRTRKVHHLIYVPDLEKARALRESLARIGNVASDGRPILGLDSRHLLEITLQSGEGSYLVPAHIWTPWFAVLGSKSGFDTIELCYGDLSGEIFALETGLSSDPPMNWRLSSLDRYSLVSNSDAHSPPKIGREACVFHTEMDYFAMRRALKTGESYGGTVEFFPEEGKYHFDGHRKCGVSLSPEETRRYEGLCPECGKPLTLGVMHRVEELADRDDVPEVRPPLAAPYRSLIPLVEVLAEVQGVGPQSKAVWQKYEDLVRRLGSELFILEHASLEDVRRAASPLVAEAVSRMRAGRVLCEAGFDGQYGTIRLFTKEELRRGSSVGILFDLSEAESTAGTAGPTETLPGDRTVGPGLPADQPANAESKAGTAGPTETPQTHGHGLLDDLDPEQRAAAEVFFGPLLIIAGPGTGKTRTLTHRLARLISEHGVPPHECLAITFTRRAAGEMAERLEKLLPNRIDRPAAMTFHRLGLSILEEHGSRLGMAEPLRVACQTEGRQLLEEALGTSERKATRLLAQISCQKRTVQAIASSPGVSAAAPDAEIAAALDVYQQQLHARGLVDFDDLVVLPVRLLETSPDLVDHYRSRYRWVSVDEYQDIDPLQYRLVRLLVPPDGNLCVIGDPDQAIYGFRGADVSCFQRFNDDFPSARTISLVRNYRSTRTIVDASLE